METTIVRSEEFLSTFPVLEKKPKGRWEQLKGLKTGMENRCQDYALWTLPSIFPYPVQDDGSTEKQGPPDSTGARAVNNLANKITSTLFPLDSPFMRLQVAADEMAKINQDANSGDTKAKAILDTLDAALALAEKNAMRELNYNHFRTEATTSVKALLVTGNTMMYAPEDSKGMTQVYNLRDYCVVRDLNGEVVEFMTRDRKDFRTFSPAIQNQLTASTDPKYKNAANSTEPVKVTIYTQVKLATTGRYIMRQYADDVELNSDGAWPKDELPWIILTWNRLRGEDYGRGLVEEYAGAFFGLYVLSNAFVDCVGVAADIKWLVDPASVLDVERLNNAESGSYHAGKKDDITAVQLDKQVDLQVVAEKIQDWRQQIGQAFLLFSAVQRQAERVTAEEIRATIQDLEAQHAGVYSRFADEWQLPVAKLMLKKVKIKIGDGRQVYPQIITGLDSLSKQVELDNVRLWMQDLQMLQTVPPQILAVIDALRFAQFMAIRRGVEYEKFLKSPQQIQHDQQQELAMQNQQVQNQNASQAAGQAAVAAVKNQM